MMSIITILLGLTVCVSPPALYDIQRISKNAEF